MNEVQFGFLMSAVAEMHAVNARVAGMIAENAHREACGNSVAYGEEAFEACAKQLSALSTTMHSIAHAMGG